MLTDAFLTVLDQTEPGGRVTGIVTWSVPGPDAGSKPLERATRTKGPVLEAAQACADARINPLEGTPQAILDLPIEGWRRLLGYRQSLLSGPDFRVEPNVTAFSTLPEPR